MNDKQLRFYAELEKQKILLRDLDKDKPSDWMQRQRIREELNCNRKIFSKAIVECDDLYDGRGKNTQKAIEIIALRKDGYGYPNL